MVGGAGGCSGDTAVAGAGFCTGATEGTFVDVGGIDGKNLTYTVYKTKSVGGSYYESYANGVCSGEQAELYDYGEETYPKRSGGIGGGCGSPYWYTGGTDYPLSTIVKNEIFSGISNCRWQSPKWDGNLVVDSAQGGKGGTIKVSENATINAYNGSYITTKTFDEMTDSERKSTQALIYAQAGYDVKAIRELRKVKVVNARTIVDLVDEWTDEENEYDFTEQRTILSPYDENCGDSLAGEFILGIGSGAGGSQEIDGNGTYTIDENLN